MEGCGKVALWNLKSKNLIWLKTSKSANFLFYGKREGWGEGVKQHFKIWRPRLEFDFKLSTVPTFHFTGGGGGGYSSTLKSEVQKSNFTWNFQICQLFILQGGGRSSTLKSEVQKSYLSSNFQICQLLFYSGNGGKVALWNLMSTNPTWLETSKSANILFHRDAEVEGGGGG